MSLSLKESKAGRVLGLSQSFSARKGFAIEGVKPGAHLHPKVLTSCNLPSPLLNFLWKFFLCGLEHITSFNPLGIEKSTWYYLVFSVRR